MSKEKEYTYLYVGMKIPELANGRDCLRLETKGNGIELWVLLKTPSPNERRDVLTGDIEFGVTEMGKILFLTVRFSPGLIFDAPYNPTIYSHPVDVADIGNLATIYFVDSATGELLGMRAIGLGYEFAETFASIVTKLQKTPITRMDYELKISMIYATTPTTTLMDNAIAKYTLKA